MQREPSEFSACRISRSAIVSPLMRALRIALVIDGIRASRPEKSAPSANAFWPQSAPHEHPIRICKYFCYYGLACFAAFTHPRFKVFANISASKKRIHVLCAPRRASNQTLMLPECGAKTSKPVRFDVNKEQILQIAESGGEKLYTQPFTRGNFFISNVYWLRAAFL